ncbi:hypothetical protein LXL04_007143 [Taraxacum kok-saghyz]
MKEIGKSQKESTIVEPVIEHRQQGNNSRRQVTEPEVEEAGLVQRRRWSRGCGREAVVVVVECRRWSAGGGGGLRWSETRSVKEVAAAEENRQWRSLGGKSEIGCKEKWEKLGHPVKTEIPQLTFVDQSGRLGGF